MTCVNQPNNLYWTCMHLCVSVLENRPEKNPVPCRYLWLIKRVVARAPMKGYFTGLSSLGRGEERGCVSEQVSSTVLGSQGDA